MTKKIIAGGCSFTFGHELSDDFESRYPSKKSWAYQLYSHGSFKDYICSAKGGIGNSAIARNVFQKMPPQGYLRHTFVKRFAVSA